MTDPSKRPRFQFRPRTLMIVVTLFALIACGYIGWQAKIVRDRLAELDRIAPKCYITYDTGNSKGRFPWIRSPND